MDSIDDEEKRLHEFEEWRTMHLDFSATKCNDLEKLDIYTGEQTSDSISKLPKCLVHMTRKMCNCDQPCIGRSFARGKIDTTCNSYDLKNIWFDDNYRNCYFLDATVKDGRFIKSDAYNMVERDGIKFMKGIYDLCVNKEIFKTLLCKAYELRDECKDEANCLHFYLKKLLERTCSNTEFDDQLAELERILGFKFYVDDDLLLADDPTINSTDLVGEDKKIFKRDVSNFDINVVQDCKNISSDGGTAELTSLHQQNSNAMISMSVISSLLFFILVVFGFQDKKKNVKIAAPAIILTLAMMIISIYSSINNNI